MINELLTLYVDDNPAWYYVRFGKERNRFTFQPTIKNKTAPVFVIWVRDGELKVAGDIPEHLAEQAKEKVREFLSDAIFDQL